MRIDLVEIEEDGSVAVRPSRFLVWAHYIALTLVLLGVIGWVWSKLWAVGITITLCWAIPVIVAYHNDEFRRSRAFGWIDGIGGIVLILGIAVYFVAR